MIKGAFLDSVLVSVAVGLVRLAVHEGAGLFRASIADRELDKPALTKRLGSSEWKRNERKKEGRGEKRRRDEGARRGGGQRKKRNKRG